MELSNGAITAANKPRRGSWTLAQKRQAVAESHVAGASVGDVARRHGVRPALLSSWRRQLARTPESMKKPTKFAAVRVSAPVVDGIIEIDLAGGCVRILGIVDGAMLREVLAATR